MRQDVLQEDSLSAGIITTNPKNGTISITQGDNTIVVSQEDRDAFLTDLDSQPYVEDQPTGVGFGGGSFPLPDKKPKNATMDEIVQKIAFLAKRSATWPYSK